MTEFELIAKLLPGLPTHSAVKVGAGDDCAVLDIGLPDRNLLFKTDALVEGVHFSEGAEPAKIGRKAIARALSDIAAMGGTPSAAVITIGLPKDFSAQRVTKIYDGINAIAREHHVAIVGGETTTNPERIFISVAMIGFVEKEKAALRSGAKVGDAIFVSGELGGSLHGRHLDFQPRLKEARWLVEHFKIHSMIDLSDGLAGDLRHLLNASGVGAELFSPAIPVSRAAKLQARNESSAKPPLLAALTDGEDFELLFTISSSDAVRLLDQWKTAFATVKLSCVGKIMAEPGLRLRDKEGVKPLFIHGYTHFAKP
jgi:thiamine-monophosphate kinase